MLAWTLVMTAHAGISVDPADVTSGIYLTGDVEVVGSPGDRGVELRTPDGRRRIPDVRAIHFSGGTLLGMAPSAHGAEAVLFDTAGRFVRRAPIPRGAKAIAYGTGIVTFPANQHEPGIPYSLTLLASRTRREIRHPDRTILDLIPLAQHLVIVSVRTDTTSPVFVEVLDETGETAWTFTTARAQNRVIVDSGRAAALSYDEHGSKLRLFDEPEPTPRVLNLIGDPLNNLAFLRPGTDILLWGRDRAILVDTADGRILWRSRLTSESRYVSNRTAFVSTIDQSVVLVSRKERNDGRWSVELVRLGLASGTVEETRWLFDASSMPSGVKRYGYAGGERIVFDSRIYDLTPTVEDAP